MDSQTRFCQSCKKEFVIDPEDFDFYEKIKVPPPTWCPECRMIRRWASLNDRAIYKRNCNLCGKSTMTSYAPDKKVTVFCNSCWWSDKWDDSKYGQDYDPDRSFFEQIKELGERTPRMALDSNYPTLVNSEYINHSATAKNCYLIFTADECENVLYSEVLLHIKDSMDVTMSGGLELCYEVINSGPCFKTFFSEDCENCQDVYFSKDMLGCNNCFGCKGLRNKSYYIWNEPHNKEEYFSMLKIFDLGSRSAVNALKDKAYAFWGKYPNKFAHALRNSNVTGDYIYSSKSSRDMYVVHEGAENCRFCSFITMPGIKDCYDYSVWGNNARDLYECMIVGEGAENIRFSSQVWPNVSDVEYSTFVHSSSHIFGCANIRNKQYCILNKQYSKEEFMELKKRIIDDMNSRPYIDSVGRVYRYGEFFPAELSYAGYNESYASGYFPLDKEDAKKLGFNWYDAPATSHQATISSKEVPDHIRDVSDAILSEIIACESCAGPFKIVPAELALLQRFGLPLRVRCPNCRYRSRLSRINPPRLAYRSCECRGAVSSNGVYQNNSPHYHGDKPCQSSFETSYSPDRPEIVYCEQCYNAETA